MIFDTSVWIHFLRGSGVKSALFLRARLNNDEDINLCLPIIQEVLQGIRQDSLFHEVKDLMLGLEILPELHYEAAVGAANLYRTLRKKGITIRKPNDCLIAWYAIQFDLTLVHDDKDFDLIALHSPLKVFSHP